MPSEKLPFLWGSATSSHQVEGNNTANDWWAWEKEGKVKTPSGPACDHYRRFRDDFDLFANLGHTAHRLSLEWSRFEPEENVWNDEAFRHYEDVLNELRARKIEPVVTLHHFTNPQWLAAKGGWLREDAVFYFERYVKRVVRALGYYVQFWITINEPLVYLFHGFLTGLWPPGHQSVRDCKTVFRNLLQAHMVAYRAIHEEYARTQKKTVWVSIAHHMTHLVPCRPERLEDRLMVYFRKWFSNFLFLDAAVSGFLFYPGFFCELLPGRETLDFIGVNYYTREFIRFPGLSHLASLGESCSKEHHLTEIKPRNSMGWEICPEGLYKALCDLKRYGLPILITENGICTETDAERSKFIQDHLAAVQQAIDQGAPVFGYLYWSGLDNFEWDSGFGPRFGITKVDYKNFQRKVKDSAHVLTENCRKLFAGEPDAKRFI